MIVNVEACAYMCAETCVHRGIERYIKYYGRLLVTVRSAPPSHRETELVLNETRQPGV